MRTITCALLGAAAAWPLLAHAAPAIGDPTNAAASVPATKTSSAFDGYRLYREDKGPGWRRLNAAVLDTPKQGATALSHSRDAQHGEAAR